MCEVELLLGYRNKDIRWNYFPWQKIKWTRIKHFELWYSMWDRYWAPTHGHQWTICEQYQITDAGIKIGQQLMAPRGIEFKWPSQSNQPWWTKPIHWRWTSESNSCWVRLQSLEDLRRKSGNWHKIKENLCQMPSPLPCRLKERKWRNEKDECICIPWT